MAISHIINSCVQVGWRWAVNEEVDDEDRRHVPFLVQLYGQEERPRPDCE